MRTIRNIVKAVKTGENANKCMTRRNKKNENEKKKQNQNSLEKFRQRTSAI